MSIDAQIRKQLIMLARRPKDQHYVRPSNWEPDHVRNPKGEFESFFTDSSAWELIAEQLEAGCEVEEVRLRKPPGKNAYVLKVDLGANESKLYIKVQLGSGKIIGRSFHYSNHP